MSPQSPKTEADEKIERHFNGIVLTVLAIMALAILIAIFLFFRKGSKVVPSAHRQSAMVRPIDLKNQTPVRMNG